MSGGTSILNRNTPSPEPASHCFDAFMTVRPFGEDGVSILVKPEADRSSHAFLFPGLLHDLVSELSQLHAVHRVVVDVTDIPIFPDNARGSLVKLMLEFSKREGVVLCGASDLYIETLETMGLGEKFARADVVRLPAPTQQITTALESALDAVDNREFARTAAFDTIDRMPVELKYNGQLLKYRIEGETAVLSLNPEILTLSKEREIAQKLADSVRALTSAAPEAQRVLLNLRGLAFMGATPMGALLSLYREGKSGSGKPFAVCCLGEAVTEKFAQTQLDRLIPTFTSEAEAIQARW